MKNQLGYLGDYHLKNFLNSNQSLKKIKRIGRTQKNPDYHIHPSTILYSNSINNNKTVNTIYPSVINKDALPPKPKRFITAASDPNTTGPHPQSAVNNTLSQDQSL
jgi:hypothetical protein